TNWLGFPGAVIADLGFQIFGLGVLALILPPALWAWRLMRLTVPTRMGLRVLAWLGAGLLGCGVLAFLPVPDSWPLPTGLGGLVGTGFSGLAALATGSEPQPVTGILFAIIISAPALALFWLAIGGGRLSRASAGPAARKAPAGASRTDSDALEPERNSVLD